MSVAPGYERATTRRFTITGGDAYCVAIGGDAAALVYTAPSNGVANQVVKVASTKTMPTIAAGCPPAR